MYVPRQFPEGKQIASGLQQQKSMDSIMADQMCNKHAILHGLQQDGLCFLRQEASTETHHSKRRAKLSGVSEVIKLECWVSVAVHSVPKTPG